jgi:sugar diacid utilization regulator
MVITADWTYVDPDLHADHARLHDALAALATLSARLAAAGSRRDDLIRLATTGVRRILDVDACRFVEHRSVPLVVDRPLTPQDEQLLAIVAHQLTLALQRADLTERLTEEHLVHDLFDAVADGRHAQAETRARAAGHDLTRPHVVAVLEPLDPADWPAAATRAEERLRRAFPGALCDPGDDRLRALLPAMSADTPGLDAELAALAREHRLAAGRSAPRAGLAAAARGLQEATTAAQVARATASPQAGGAARAYDQLGVYRYLAQLPQDHAPDERHAAAIATLAAYDARRRTELLRTLERHLGDRGALAATARALYIHTNTLRQRLDRIEALTDLDLHQEDLLSLELAVKLARLHGSGNGTAPRAMSPSP